MVCFVVCCVLRHFAFLFVSQDVVHFLSLPPLSHEAFQKVLTDEQLPRLLLLTTTITITTPITTTTKSHDYQTCVRCAARPPLDWGEAGARHSLFLFFCTLPGARSAGSRVGYRMDDLDDAIRVLDGACILHSLSKKKKNKNE